MAERISSQRAEQMDRAAAWARTFEGTSESKGTPRTQYEAMQEEERGDRRRLYANDIDEAVNREKARAEQEFEELQIRKPAVGNLMLNRQKEERAAEDSRLRRSLDREKFDWTKQKDQIGNEINQLREQRAIAQERRLLNEHMMKEKRGLREDEQTFAAQQYIQGMAEKGQLPGSPEFAYGASEVLRQNPYISDDYRARLVEDMQLIEDPKEAAAAAARGDRVTRTQGPDGKPRYTYVSSPDKADSGKADLYKERSHTASRVDRLEKNIIAYPKDKIGSDEYKRAVEERDALRRRYDEADAKIRGVQQPKPASGMGDRAAVDAANPVQTQAATPPPQSSPPAPAVPPQADPQAQAASQPTSQNTGARRMRAPDGQIRFVNPDSFEKYKAKGATFVD